MGGRPPPPSFKSATDVEHNYTGASPLDDAVEITSSVVSTLTGSDARSWNLVFPVALSNITDAAVRRCYHARTQSTLTRNTRNLTGKYRQLKHFIAETFCWEIFCHGNSTTTANLYCVLVQDNVARLVAERISGAGVLAMPTRGLPSTRFTPDDSPTWYFLFIRLQNWLVNCQNPFSGRWCNSNSVARYHSHLAD